jgi:hypothetical protein
VIWKLRFARRIDCAIHDAHYDTHHGTDSLNSGLPWVGDIALAVRNMGGVHRGKQGYHRTSEREDNADMENCIFLLTTFLTNDRTRNAQTRSSLANIQDQRVFATIAQDLCLMRLCAEETSAAREVRPEKERIFKVEEMSQPSHTSVAHLAVHADVR